MQSIHKLVRRGALGAEPLPAPFASWAARKMLFRKGSVHLFAAVAGMHKTMVMLNAVVNMGVPTLAFSTDSDDFTVASRLIAIKTGRTTDSAEHWMAKSPDEAAGILEPFRHLIQWQFNPNPTLDDIWLETYAYLEVYGTWPELIVLDILSDVGHDSGDEWSSLRDVMRQAKVLARETGAAVLLVHHASEGVPSSRICPSRGDIMGKSAAQPVLMVTFGKDAAGNFWAACVKNRFGKANANGEDRFRMSLNPSTSVVGDWVEQSNWRGADWDDDD